MSWVLLSLRKSELKALHAYYVAEDLKISRAQRQAARRYQYEQRGISTDEQKQLLEKRTDYKIQRQDYYSQLSAKREKIAALDSNAKDYQTQYSALEKEYADIQQQMNDAKNDYDEETNDIKTLSEEDMAMIEEEANDVDTQYEQDKVTIETQMEAVAQELQAVSDAISQQIQNETIKIS